MVFAFLIYIIMLGTFVLAMWQIWAKAGFNGAWSLLMFVPIVNLVSFFYLAFAEWPVHRMLGSPDDFR